MRATPLANDLSRWAASLGAHPLDVLARRVAFLTLATPADDECTEESCNYYLYVINTGALPIEIADLTFTPSMLSEAEREECEPPNTGTKHLAPNAFPNACACGFVCRRGHNEQADQ